MMFAKKSESKQPLLSLTRVWCIDPNLHTLPRLPSNGIGIIDCWSGSVFVISFLFGVCYIYNSSIVPIKLLVRVDFL